MSYELTAIFTCDNCGKRETMHSLGAPAGWTGHAPSLPSVNDGLFAYATVAVFGATLKEHHWCDECNAAARDAYDRALIQRRTQARTNAGA